MTVKFIEAPDKKGQALQVALRVMGAIRYGGTVTPEQAECFINYFSLALPMKYRFPKSTWEEIKLKVQVETWNPEANNETPQN
jgi:hypothetical protein